MNTKPLARNKDLVIQETGIELLVYDLKTNKAFCLNETSTPIWQLCNGENSVSEIAKKMSRQMKTEITEDFVWIALDQLKKDGLLDERFESPFEGVSRREIIRKVGFSSFVALPIISAVIAPEAASAQSGVGAPFYDCTSDGICNSGLLCVPTTNCPNLNPSCTPTGIAQCCAGSSRLPGSIFCTLNPCAPQGSSQCCTGNVSTAPPVVGCNGVGQITCLCN